MENRTGRKGRDVTMKKLEISLLAALLLCIAALAMQLPFVRACEALTEDTFRLHILANSDSDADQAVKLAVRDAILAESNRLFAQAATAEEAAVAAQHQLSALEAVANETLRAHGFGYTARAYVTRMPFETRYYGDFTLPAGTYTALRIELGRGEGKNWWCVLYPALCLPAAEQESELEALTEEEQQVVEGGERFALRFKFLEWFARRDDA